MFPNFQMKSLQTSALIPLPMASLTLWLRSLSFCRGEIWKSSLVLFFVFLVIVPFISVLWHTVHTFGVLQRYRIVSPMYCMIVTLYFLQSSQNWDVENLLLMAIVIPTRSNKMTKNNRYLIFFFLSTNPWNDQNQQWVDSNNKYCLYPKSDGFWTPACCCQCSLEKIFCLISFFVFVLFVYCVWRWHLNTSPPAETTSLRKAVTNKLPLKETLPNTVPDLFICTDRF